jgi:ribonuclease HI
MSMSTIIYADGAAKNNPGQASAAAVVVTDGQVVATYANLLGVQTNNVAEYHGLLLALHAAHDLGITEPIIRMDSNLVVQQFIGNWKCKEPALRGLLAQAQALKQHFGSIDIAWIPREDNALADQAGNDVLDGSIASFLPLGYDISVAVEPMRAKPAAAQNLPLAEVDFFCGAATHVEPTCSVTRRDLIALVNAARDAAASDKYDLVDALMKQKSA